MEASKTTQNNIFALVVIFMIFQFLMVDRVYSAGLSTSPLLTTRNAQYSKPLYFDVLGGPEMPTPFVEYSMEENGSQLKLGSVIINEKTFSVGLRKLTELDAGWNKTNTLYFYLKWPSFLFNETVVELLNRDGNVIWKKELTKEVLQDWVSTAKKELKKIKSPINEINWAIESSSAELPLQGLADGFKFCLTPLQQNSQARLCSQNYVIRPSGRQILLGRLKQESTPRILVNAEVAPAKGEIKVEGGLPVRFFAELGSGETLEFTSKPLNVAWSDFTRMEGKDIYTVIGFEAPPAGPYKILNPDRYSKLTQSIGFESTILDTRKFWVARVKENEPWLYFPGESGGIFKHPLPLELAPSSKLRLHLSKATPPGTYRDGVKVKGRKQAFSVLTSKEYNVSSDPNSEQFVWSFKAQNNARINRSTLLLSDNGKTYRSYFEIYKGYSNELSTRLSMILSTSGLILMGEAAYNLWFEDVLGWDNYYFSKQRWGLSTKYFQSITKYKVEGAGSASLTVMNADLKYRFTPGLWTRDESHGAMVSYQDFEAKLTTTRFKTPMMGIGWFWARSMPKVVDELFSILPYMDYPKWVDMEFIYYAASTDATKKLNFNFALNFHGQVLWKDNFFGEAGFGIKRYDFVDTTNSLQRNLGYQLNTLYGTVGMGFKF